ncbi:glycoside hydrolase family 97 N-terminal domain-containing protein, partial [Flavihumibacter sp. CACIAM 22H1]|uniref:glycoside hydrolase family 97 N-terminal domain-containing protein n=1 Tax=Flavihumibacter sp. CACIAM 22H1 TaxID=1812911 RepID=UPI0025C4BBB7
MLFTRLFVVVFYLGCFSANAQELIVASPDQRLQVKAGIKNGELYYQVFSGKKVVLLPSRLGLRLKKQDFSGQLTLLQIGDTEPVRDDYTMLTGKKSVVHYRANKKSIWLKNRSGKKLELVFQVSNDGLAFRYHLPDGGNQEEVAEELTSYHFPDTSRSWLQPMSEAKTGWEQSNPSYEETYFPDQPVGAFSRAGWVYPALFRSNASWVLISEAAVDSQHCASRLINDPGSSNYRVGIPDLREIFPGGRLLSQVNGNWYSPWRVLAIGSLSTITSSTLGTDLASPSRLKDLSFIKGGQASWSWINSKDDSIVYTEQKKYISYA